MLARERKENFAPTRGLVQGHVNLVGGNYIWGKLDKSKELADFYAALNSASFSSDTDDDAVLNPTVHSRKTNKKNKSKTPHSYFNGK